MEEENQVFQGEILGDMDEEDIIEGIRAKRVRSDVKTSDIITMQCILCIVLAILVIVMNMLLPQLTGNILENYKAASSAPGESNGTLVSIVSKISDFMNATPNDRV